VSDSDTPRTDGLADSLESMPTVDGAPRMYALAQQLERELVEATHRLSDSVNHANKMEIEGNKQFARAEKAEEERDEARLCAASEHELCARAQDRCDVLLRREDEVIAQSETAVNLARERTEYAEQLTKLTRTFVDAFYREFHSGQAKAERWQGWENGLDLREPEDAACYALMKFLSEHSAALSIQSKSCSDDAAENSRVATANMLAGRGTIQGSVGSGDAPEGTAQSVSAIHNAGMQDPAAAAKETAGTDAPATPPSAVLGVCNSERVELGCAGHLIVAAKCHWRRHTQVGGYRVSTVGDYHPDRDGERECVGGSDNAYFETMVFETENALDGGNEGCGCRVVKDWSGIDCERYATAGEAQAGHERYVAKYSAVHSQGNQS